MVDDIRVIVAAHACLLLLNRKTNVYPQLHSILVYPSSFRVESVEVDEAGVVIEEEQEMLGESWRTGALVLSWEDVLEDLENPQEGYNVILHEFAHQLDDETGESDGTPLLDTAEQIRRWHEVMDREFRTLQDDISRNRPTLLDEYGAESPTEFFATTTEAFFLLSGEMQKEHSELYELLADFYGLDPIV
jgi:Mlc titration factor MtfA (ptsG expression regulator)